MGSMLQGMCVLAKVDIVGKPPFLFSGAEERERERRFIHSGSYRGFWYRMRN